MYKYPFTAIVGQEAMKTALILNTIDPSIGGVLIRSHKGTAKSTAVRALPDLLLPLQVVEGCPYHCDPGAEIFEHEDCRKKAENGQSMPVKEYAVPPGRAASRSHRRQAYRVTPYREDYKCRRKSIRTRSSCRCQPRYSLCG